MDTYIPEPTTESYEIYLSNCYPEAEDFCRWMNENGPHKINYLLSANISAQVNDGDWTQIPALWSGDARHLLATLSRLYRRDTAGAGQ